MASKNVIIAIVVVVVVVVAAVSVVEFYHPSKIAHPSVFTDVSQTAAPDHLDPASGFFTTDEPLFTAIYQELVEFNGTSLKVVPVLAQNYTNYNNQNYTFTIRSYAKFSNNEPLNASDVWFSIYRGIVMAQGPFTSDYPGILFNATNFGNIGIALPWGVRAALVNAGFTLSGNLSTQYTQAVTLLDNILSNFNYNATDMKVMEYPHQAIVVKSNDVVEINSMVPYPFMLQDLAGWWGAVIYPAYIDQHGGVVYNTENSYANLNGTIGSGPYMFKSIATGFSTIVIEKNPNYWAAGQTGVPSVAQPGSIPEIAIEYGLSHTDRLEDFDTNASAISTIAPSSFKSMINGFYNSADRNGNLVKAFPEAGVFYISMNCGMFPTNITAFRYAMTDAMNYTAQADIFDNNFNGSAEAFEQLGPLSPSFGPNYYNPTNIPLQSQDLKGAIANLTIAGDEGHFYVVLPNGTKIGDTSGTDLSSTTFTITGISPPNTVETDQVTVAIDSFKLIGLKFTSSFVAESIVADWTNATDTPQFVDLGWVPDYPDPIGQQLMPVFDVIEGGVFGGNDAWVNNATLQHYFTNLDFESASAQQAAMKVIYPITAQIDAYIWLPMPYAVYFVQPYVHNFKYNPYVGYFYNLMYVSYGSGSSSSVSFQSLSSGSPFTVGNLIQTGVVTAVRDILG